MTDETTCPKCKADLTAKDAVAFGRCRDCGWDLSLPDSAAKKTRPVDPRRYEGKGRKR
jgi:ribosomal protein L37AE/L43A